MMQRCAGIASVVAATCVILALISANLSRGDTRTELEPSVFDLTSSIGTNRARTDLDPGSLQGLIQAAAGSLDSSSWPSLGQHAMRRRHGMKHVNGPALTLQQHETTQQRIEHNLRASHRLKQSLGSTIAKYFTTVRSVKDDQGTFLG